MISSWLALLLWVFIAAVGVQLLPWPLAASAVAVGIGIAVVRLRHAESRPPAVEPDQLHEALPPRLRDPESWPRG